MKHLLGTATATATALACSCSGSGYAVVDPMPVPARCAGNPPAIKAGAQLLASAEGTPEILLLLGKAAPEKATLYTDGAPVVTGGSLVSYRITDEALEVRIRPADPAAAGPALSGPAAPAASGAPPAATAPAITVEVALSCSDGPGRLIAKLTLPPLAQPGATLDVTLDSPM